MRLALFPGSISEVCRSAKSRSRFPALLRPRGPIGLGLYADLCRLAFHSAEEHFGSPNVPPSSEASGGLKLACVAARAAITPGLEDSTLDAKRCMFCFMEPARNRYAPQAAFCGSVQWLCPGCGKVRRSRIDYQTWRVRCGNSRCRRAWGIGLTFYDLSELRASGRRHGLPRDLLLELEPVELDYWRGSGPVHRHAIVLQSPLADMTKTTCRVIGGTFEKYTDS